MRRIEKICLYGRLKRPVVEDGRRRVCKRRPKDPAKAAQLKEETRIEMERLIRSQRRAARDRAARHRAARHRVVFDRGERRAQNDTGPKCEYGRLKRPVGKRVCKRGPKKRNF